ncbi:MAG TPA: hypothetical protein VMI52_11575 [Acetobacteraceae bacterium]|nr:hypothetical protein [Acetobacteraceae bacterium]
MSEEKPATPGWVAQELEEIAATLPRTPEVTARLGEYAECLAGCCPPADPEAGRDRCRERLLHALREQHMDRAALDRLRERLEALEQEITDRT